MAAELVNRRLPGTSQRVLGLSARYANEQPPDRTMGKISRAVIPGSRLFNTIFGLLRTGREYREIFGRKAAPLPVFGLCPHADTPTRPFAKSWLLAPRSTFRFFSANVPGRTPLARRTSRKDGLPDGLQLIDRGRVDSRSSKVRTAV